MQKIQEGDNASAVWSIRGSRGLSSDHFASGQTPPTGTVQTPKCPQPRPQVARVTGEMDATYIVLSKM